MQGEAAVRPWDWTPISSPPSLLGTASSRRAAFWVYVSTIVVSFLSPLVVLVFAREPFVRACSRRAFNLQATLVLAAFTSWLAVYYARGISTLLVVLAILVFFLTLVLRLTVPIIHARQASKGILPRGWGIPFLRDSA